MREEAPFEGPIKKVPSPVTDFRANRSQGNSDFPNDERYNTVRIGGVRLNRALLFAELKEAIRTSSSPELSRPDSLNRERYLWLLEQFSNNVTPKGTTIAEHFKISVSRAHRLRRDFLIYLGKRLGKPQFFTPPFRERLVAQSEDQEGV